MFNAIEFHEAWSNALFAAAGALMVNVLTGFQGNTQYIVALILAFASLSCFSYFTKTKATADKKHVVNKALNALKNPEEQELDTDIFEEVFRIGEKPRKANVSFYGGLTCIIISIFLVIQANVEAVNTDQKQYQKYIALLEKSQEINEKLFKQNDTLREELLKQSDTLHQQLLEQNDALREQLLKQSESLQKQYELQLSGKASAQIDVDSKDAPQYDRPVDSQ